MKQNRQSSLMNPLTFSIAALAIIVIFLVVMTPSLYRSGQTVFIAAPESDDAMDKLLARHEQNMLTDVDRFNGRSFFYTPPIQRKPPPPPPPPPPRPVEEEEKPPPPPPEPTFPPNYTGPKLVAILGSEAWFKEASPDGDPLTRLNIGDPHDDIDVLATDPPRGITVKYRGGGPYEVDLINMESTPFVESPRAVEVARGILEDVDPDADPAIELPADQQCEIEWRRSNSELGWLSTYEPAIALAKRIEIYRDWLDWWDRTPDTMRSLGAPSAQLLEAMISELETELEHMAGDGLEPDEAGGSADPQGEDSPDTTPKSTDSAPADTDTDEGS